MGAPNIQPAAKPAWIKTGQADDLVKMTRGAGMQLFRDLAQLVVMSKP